MWRKHSSKKCSLLLISVSSFFLLSAAWFATVEIKTENGGPLIDLDSLFAAEESGQPGSSDDGKEKDPNDNKEDGSADSGEKDVNSSIEIVVYDKSIFYKGKTYAYDRTSDTVENFDQVLKDAKNQKVVIRDNYAEAHAYKCVLKAVEGVVKAPTDIIRKTTEKAEGK